MQETQQYIEGSSRPEIRVTQEVDGICLIGHETVSDLSMEQVKGLAPTEESIITTDFSVTPYTVGEPIEDPNTMLTMADGRQVPLLIGVRYPNGVWSFDHHHPRDPRMWREVSSTNLAQAHIALGGRRWEKAYITHTDADSVMASYVLRTGDTDPELGEAAIAADHTGAENRIADVLQAATDNRDLAYSLACLQALREGRPLPAGAEKLLDGRKRDRERAYTLVTSGIMEKLGNGIYIARTAKGLPAEFLPSLIPDAQVIMIATPMDDKEGYYVIKIRSGMQFPAGKSLEPLSDIINGGGRWDALSNKRKGGVSNVDQTIENVVAAIAIL